MTPWEELSPGNRSVAVQAVGTLRTWAAVPAKSSYPAQTMRMLLNIAETVTRGSRTNMQVTAEQVTCLVQAVRWQHQVRILDRYPFLPMEMIPFQQVEADVSSIVEMVFRTVLYCDCQPSGQTCSRCDAASYGLIALDQPLDDAAVGHFTRELDKLEIRGQRARQSKL